MKFSFYALDWLSLILSKQNFSGDICNDSSTGLQITGTQKNDVLIGTRYADTLSGAAGNDILIGKAGNDKLNGGDGRDWLFGNAGNDTLRGDRFIAYEASYNEDILKLNADNILKLNREGQDVLIGGSGNDFLEGGAGKDTLIGGQGDDVLWGGYNAKEGIFYDKIYDYWENSYGNDFLVGNAGDDTLRGDSIWVADIGLITELVGDDTLYGGSGNDLLEGGGGTDYLYGGSGNDRLFANYEAPTVKYQLYNDDGDILYGGSGDDYLEGSSGDNFLDGGSGNDTLIGDSDNDNAIMYASGQDTLIGGIGDDLLKAGYGSDFLDGGDGNDVLIDNVVYQENETTIDTLTGGVGADQFILGTLEQTFYPSESLTKYTLITDFNSSQDIIQLAGSYFLLNDFSYGTAKYILGSSPEGLPEGTGIYLDLDTDILIGIVQGVSGLSLDQNYFRIVDVT